MAEADRGALSAEQESRLRAWKIQTRTGNERYLRRHPELRLLLSTFIRDTLLTRPHNIAQHAADYFTEPTLAEAI